MTLFRFPGFIHSKPLLKPILIVLMGAASGFLQGSTWQTVESEDPPVCNPLKGFVCYAEDYEGDPRIGFIELGLVGF